VSLVPSITETLLAWGVPPVAVTRFCEAPDVPKVGGTKNPDVEAIVALDPDVVLMDREENRAEDAEALAAAGIRVHATHVLSVGDVGPALREISNLLGAELDSPEAEVDAAPAQPFFRAWIPIWRRPWMTLNGSTYGSSLLALAGIENIFAPQPDTYPQAGPDEAKALQAELVLAPSEPYPFSERHRAELELVAPAVFVDGRDLFWWGSRTPEAAVRVRALAAELAHR
jgi:ABC-type Fe3+-hydroxamate transport system substrate-binding protein